MNKDGTPKDSLTLRKSSVSQGPGTPYGLSSPTTTRPGARRRDTSDAYPFPQSPATSRFAREDANTVTPPPALVRRRTDYKDAPGSASEDRDKDRQNPENTNVFGTLKRTTTAPFSPGGSQWSAPGGGGFSPMGAFGNFGNGPQEKKPGT